MIMYIYLFLFLLILLNLKAISKALYLDNLPFSHTISSSDFINSHGLKYNMYNNGSPQP